MIFKILFPLFLSATISVFAQNYSIKPQHVEKDPQIIVEPDQTDIFAIPLDEDAEDQQEELYQLEHPGNKGSRKI